MNTYSITLLVVSFLSTVIVIFIQSPRLKNAFKTITSLIITLLILSTISSLLTSLLSFGLNFKDSSNEYDNTLFNDNVINETGKQICEYTKDMLCTKFAIPEDSIEVTATLEKNLDNEIYIKIITIRLLYNIDIDKQTLAQTVSDTLMCDCTVLY